MASSARVGAACAVVVSLLLQLVARAAAADDAFCSAAKTDGNCDGGSSSDQTRFSASSELFYKVQVAGENYRQCGEGGCECYEAVIDSDLAKFPKVTRKMLSDVREVARHSVVYQIIEGRVYRSPEKCLFPLRCRGVEHFLAKLAPKFERDSELVVNFHDWPHISERFHSAPLPLFSFSKTNEYSDIFYPAWTFWEAIQWLQNSDYFLHWVGMTTATS